MALSRLEMDHLALLARIGLSDDEKDRMANQLGDILQHMERLNQLDTEHIPPTAQIIEAANVLRDDEPRPGLTHDQALANAPRAEEPFVRVLPILE
ncbi:MAG TPA: Asp-tRNA(Asn)/Glu-tRNA(Gln) amidotransferase subunit GatC [Chloroflexota bacterium]|nr:Asp-tRNA(Asn)/Glu-tRNA(Gln) amidotransferase subunit GatC [Chloroflexota bacterium]